MKKGKLYRCHLCQGHTGTLHELVYGTGWRDISISFNVQLPICNRPETQCHTKVHKNPDKYMPELLQVLGLDKATILKAYRQRNWNYLESIKENNKKIIEWYEVY